jgi:4'-phosphopantetheinyl transferase
LEHKPETSPADWPLSPDLVHVWELNLDLSAAATAWHELCLSTEERARRDRFHFEKLQRRFTACRGQVRHVLAAYLQDSPERLQFVYGPQGKPELAPPWHSSRLKFNVSHSGDTALIGIACDREIGVDLELFRSPHDLEGIAEQFFAAEEAAAIRALPPDQQIRSFLACWTRKEAVLKGEGVGLSVPLNEVVVSVLPSEPARVIRYNNPLGIAQVWWLEHLEAADRYIGAVASPGPPFRVARNIWPPQGEIP